MNASESLSSFRKAIPFLNAIPDFIYFGLDTREWVLPNDYLNEKRKDLELALGAHVMTYRRSVFYKDQPLITHLCAWLTPAELDPYKRNILLEAEKKSGRISFVVYKKPIEFQNPTESAIAKFY